MSSNVEQQFKENDENGSWISLFKTLKKAEDLSVIGNKLSVLEARKPENRNKNRYRDVNPYDHSRIALINDIQDDFGDYINANLIKINEAHRKYILTQGPLEHTGGHFWQMVWEQETMGIVMLNRIIEKGTVKCHQYWPLGINHGCEEDIVFPDVGFKVVLLDEEENEHYIIRSLKLQNLSTDESRRVLHFQYITWPDFGVPSSPHAFLNFLMAVRESGSLSNKVGPSIVHCSAGIGRSGTFCLVDSALVIVEKNWNMDAISIEDMLKDMRYYRMGLIQTPDQLRFSYLSIIEGGKHILSNPPPVEDEGGDNMNSDIPPTPPKRTTSLMPDIPNPAPNVAETPSNGDLPHDTSDEEDEETTTETDSHLLLTQSTKQTPPSIPSQTTPTASPSKKPRSAEVVCDTLEAVIKKDEDEEQQQQPPSPPPSTTAPPPTLPCSSNNTTTDTTTTTIITQPSLQSLKEQSVDHLNNSINNAEADADTASNSVDTYTQNDSDSYELRRRIREERKKGTQKMIENMKRKQKECELMRHRNSYLTPMYIGIALALGGSLLLYRYYNTGD